MLANTFLNDVKYSLLDIILIVLIICVLVILVKYIKCKLKKYRKKKIITGMLIVLSLIIAIILIATSILFFYKTYMIKMLIPAAFGVILIIVAIMAYVLVFDENEVG